MPGLFHSIVILRFIPIVGCMDNWFLFIVEYCTVVMGRSHFVYSFSCGWAFGFFWFGAITDCTFMLDDSLRLALRPIVSLISVGVRGI